MLSFMENHQFKILLVDDEPDILEIIGYNLSAEGYEIHTATNGLEALKKANKVIPDLIVLDVMMPEMDGIETCEKIRNMAPLKDVLVMFLSARAEEYSQVAGLEAGADDYITKPIKPKLLVSKVKSLLRRKTNSDNPDKILHLGNITIDREAYKVQKDQKEINLPRKEFELLALLFSKPGKVFTRDLFGSD